MYMYNVYIPHLTYLTIQLTELESVSAKTPLHLKMARLLVMSLRVENHNFILVELRVFRIKYQYFQPSTEDIF